ncbi:MAG: purine-nucleoside phosphorylase [Planctomycetia bacterium]|nr:purine-nucleoside phosphorylase [Planctomycetia bacterium]
MSEIAQKSEFDQIAEAVAAIRSRWSHEAEVGIILGTGLGNLAGKIEADVVIPYAELPHFPRSTVETHAGQLILGRLQGKRVVAMQGRFHLYEGYTAKQVTFPVRVMKALGASTLIVSNACGGLNPQFRRGDIMLLEDHINLLGANPLIGVNDDRLGPRWPDMIEPYSHDLLDKAKEVALRLGIPVQQGVYVAVPGPSLETRAEYRFLRMTGADVVGMSTVPEVIVAVHAGMKVLGFSIITDMGLPDALQPVQISEIIAAANAAEPKMNQIICGVLDEL